MPTGRNPLETSFHTSLTRSQNWLKVKCIGNLRNHSDRNHGFPQISLNYSIDTSFLSWLSPCTTFFHGEKPVKPNMAVHKESLRLSQSTQAAELPQPAYEHFRAQRLRSCSNTGAAVLQLPEGGRGGTAEGGFNPCNRNRPNIGDDWDDLKHQ